MSKNVLKREEYSRSLPNSRWLRDMLEDESARYIGDDGFKTSSEILKQCVMIKEDKPILL